MSPHPHPHPHPVAVGIPSILIYQRFFDLFLIGDQCFSWASHNPHFSDISPLDQTTSSFFPACLHGWWTDLLVSPCCASVFLSCPCFSLKFQRSPCSSSMAPTGLCCSWMTTMTCSSAAADTSLLLLQTSSDVWCTRDSMLSCSGFPLWSTEAHTSPCTAPTAAYRAKNLLLHLQFPKQIHAVSGNWDVRVKSYWNGKHIC